MKPRGRWLLIALAAIGTGIAAWSAPDAEAPPASTAVKPPAESTPVLTLPARQRLGPLRGPLFTAPAPPKPPTPQPVQAEAPRPPPNPYRYVGSIEHGGQRRVLLATADDKIVEATEGLRLDQGWLVKGVTPQAVTLVYEPLNEPVTVALVFPDLPPQAATGQTAQPVPQPVPQASDGPRGWPASPPNTVR